MSLSQPADDWFDPTPPAAARKKSSAPVLMVGAMLAAVAIVAHSKLGLWMRGFLSHRVASTPRAIAPLRLSEATSLPALRDSILGQRKRAIAEAYGPPPTVAATEGAVVAAAGFWPADLWYYAVDEKSRTAMAIRFVNGIAMSVEFFEAPRRGDENVDRR